MYLYSTVQYSMHSQTVSFFCREMCKVVSTDRRITDYNAKVGWNHPCYKLHSTVMSLVLSSLGGQKLVLHVVLFVRRSKAGAWHWHGIVSCPDPLARFFGRVGGSGDETRHGTPWQANFTLRPRLPGLRCAPQPLLHHCIIFSQKKVCTNEDKLPTDPHSLVESLSSSEIIMVVSEVAI